MTRYTNYAVRVFGIGLLLLLATKLMMSRSMRRRRKAVPYTYKKPPFSDKLARIAENVAQRASNGRKFVVLTVGTYAYRKYIRNLGCSLTRVGNQSALVLALDRRLHRAAMPSSLRVHLFSDDWVGAYRAYGSPQFNELSRRKLDAVAAVLATGYDVLFVDGDTVFCTGNAPRELADAARGHIAFQFASLPNHFANTGVYYARACDEALRFLLAARHKPALTEQHSANDIACHGGVRAYVNLGALSSRRWPPDFCVWNRTTTISAFAPRRRFPLGCTEMGTKQFRRHSPSEVSSLCTTGSIALVHYSCYSSKDKMSSMRQHKLWFVFGDTGRCSSPN